MWTPAVEESLAQASDATIFPGMMFSLAKPLMETTRLWSIVRKMPKGALLHAHMDAMVDFDFLVGELLATPGMHMSASAPLSGPQALEDADPSFRFRREADAAAGTIWTDEYVPGRFVPLAQAAGAFPDGGKAGFARWLKGRCVISRTDSVEQHHGVDAIWRKFAKCFVVVGTIIHYEPMFRAFLKKLMASLHEDGINWVELR